MNNRSNYGLTGCLMFAIACGLCLWILPNLGRMLLLGGGLVGFGIVALIVAMIVTSFKGNSSSTTKSVELSPEQAELINSGKSKVISIRSTLGKIKNKDIRENGYSICRTCDRIFKALSEQPKSITSARQFLTYYLPTINLILEKYEKVERSGTDSGQMAEKVISYLKDVDKALSKFYTNLFDNEKLDLTVEMEAMTMAAKSDGLITDEDYKIEDGDHEITLTL